MDELQRENLQQKQEISELRCGSDSLVLELQSSKDSVVQLEQQLQQKEELVCHNIFAIMHACFAHNIQTYTSVDIYT